MKQTLEITQLVLKLAIGVSQEEREKLQDIEFNILIHFATIPEACFSDQIDDTICYAQLVEQVKNFCHNHSFHLIESLGFNLYKDLKDNYLAQQDKLTLQVCKAPPLDEIKGKSCFTITD